MLSTQQILVPAALLHLLKSKIERQVRRFEVFILPNITINVDTKNGNLEAGRAPQRIVPIAIPVSGSGGKEVEGREKGTVEGFEPTVRRPK